MVRSMEDWAGKVAVFNGAGAELGAKIIEKLVSNGMIVVGLTDSLKWAKKLPEELQGQPGKLHLMKVDVTNDGELAKAFEEIEKKVDVVHVLINSSGMFPVGKLSDGTPQTWRRVIDLNVLAGCIATREAIRIMEKNSVDGIIINLNSVISGNKEGAAPDMQLHHATKYAVTSVCESLRRELISKRSKIRVTSISPGATHTDKSKCPVDMPLLSVEDIADSIEYILSTPPHVQIKELTLAAVGDGV